MKFSYILLLCFLPFIVNGETYYFSSPQNGFANNLATAIEEAKSNDIFVLSSSGGNYIFENSVSITQPIKIMADEDIQNPTVQTENGEQIFTISGNGSLEIISLNLNTAKQIEVPCIKIASPDNDLFSYQFTARNSSFITNNYTAIKAESNTLASEILLENCFFHNSKCLSFDNSLGNEASFISLELHSCVFLNCQEGAFYLHSKTIGSHGTVLLDHCVFDSTAQTDSLFILNIEGVDELQIKNSVFSSSSNASPFKLQSNTTLDYCNFYRCNDLGIATGSNCLYYNPSYDPFYFVTNESLFGKADDGRNIGPLEWVYNGSEEDTIDIGDNPNAYENQGVWVVPQVDSLGRWESYFLKYKSNGKLRYRKQAEGDIIPDFSYVGYQMGNESILELNVIATIHPIEGNASEYFQKVIDSVAENVPLNDEGFRGAILVKAGVYNLASAIFIKSNGIVLRGEGESEDETVLIAGSNTKTSMLISIGATGGSLNKIQSTATDIAASYIPVGAKYVLVSTGHVFEVNDHVCLVQQMNDQWVSDIKMDKIPDDGDVTQWNPSDYTFTYERKVKHVGSGTSVDTIFFYNPIVMALDAKYNNIRKLYKCTFSERINNSGVENMLLKSYYENDTDEEHTWDAVYFNRAEHCWAKNVTSRFFAYSCANVSSYARFITLTHCTSLSPKSIVTGGRRYSFNCNGQTNLFTYCKASEGRHDFVTGARVCGPNVFSFCSATSASNDIGPHHRWAVGTLYDNVTTDYEMNVRDRSNYGTGHGWAGANMVMWNCAGESAICQNPWASAKNYCIGFTGKYVNDDTFGDRPRGEWDGNNVKGLNPASLYYAQRKDNDLSIDFGLENDQGLFINDSTFRVYFNQPFDESSAINLQNYLASGSASVSGNPTSVSVADSISVDLHFTGFGILIFSKQVVINISGVESKNGDSFAGISKCSVIIPDLRPVVDIHYQEVSNGADATAELMADKDGELYIIHSTEKPESSQHIKQLVEQGFGNSEPALSNSLVKISTFELAEGTYFAYAVDQDGRLSNKGQYAVVITNVLSILNENSALFEIYGFNNEIRINVFDTELSNTYVTIFDALGRTYYANRIRHVNTIIPLKKNDELLIVCLSINGNMYSKKILNFY